jgi:hypothetical protein
MRSLSIVNQEGELSTQKKQLNISNSSIIFKKLLLMKRIVLLLTFSFLTQLAAHAQVPQSVCYQAVATDQAGHELVNQNVKVRISILKTAVGGVAEWIEEHAVSTDGFGLFDLKIGLGNRTGGTQPVFSNIKWGTDKFFLKVEMDVTGGTNYVLMGTNQMLSVPYSLYSEGSKTSQYADSSRISNVSNSARYADSSRTSNTSNISRYADSSRTSNYANNSYRSVRADTALYANLANRAVNADNVVNAQNALHANLADTATAADRSRISLRALFADTATAADRARTAGYANNAGNAVNAQTALRANFADTATAASRALTARYATAAGKADTATVSLRALNDRDTSATNEIQTMTMTNNILSLSNPAGAPSTVNFNNFILRGPGASIDYPLGIIGDAMKITTNYTVPAGNTLFVTAVNAQVDMNDGKILYNEPGMPIIPENNTISTCYCTALLVPNQTYCIPIILDFTNPNYEYLVPPGKYLILKSGKTNGGRLDLQIDNDSFNFFTSGNSSPRVIAVGAGKRIKKPITLLPQDKLVLTGYLLYPQ